MQDKLYIVRWLKDGAIVNEERFANLEDAKAHATEMAKLYRTVQLATSALVCDDNGNEYMRVF